MYLTSLARVRPVQTDREIRIFGCLFVTYMLLTAADAGLPENTVNASPCRIKPIWFLKFFRIKSACRVDEFIIHGRSRRPSQAACPEPAGHAAPHQRLRGGTRVF